MNVLDGFKKIYGYETNLVYFAPGRVNLIGEHVDYNGGMVLPCALTIGTYGVVSLKDDDKIRVYSENFAREGIINLSLSSSSLEKEYYDYIIALLAILNKKGLKITRGFDLYLYGNIPNGSGLSSSASLTVLLGFMLNDLFDLGMNKVDIALLGQSCEHYVGVNCGIMDHFASSLGNDGKAIYLNTNTLDYSYAPVDFKDYQLVVMNTNKKRKLTDSKYNERRSECDTALEILKKTCEINTLCDLDPLKINEYKSLLNDEVLFKRVKHAVLENYRVKLFTLALENNDLLKVGELLTSSHESLKNDYEVTGIELDTLVLSLLKQNGTIGARMVGAGFGGCAIALIKKANVTKAIENVINEYETIIGYKPTAYLVEIGDGVRKL